MLLLTNMGVALGAFGTAVCLAFCCVPSPRQALHLPWPNAILSKHYSYIISNPHFIPNSRCYCPHHRDEAEATDKQLAQGHTELGRGRARPEPRAVLILLAALPTPL